MRKASIRALREGGPWDVLVIGGGATGLGVAVDAASRGYRSVLLERADFGQGTSSRSTKLIHGGVRYLEQGRVRLVKESLRERHLLLQNAPDLVRPLRFLVPAYSRWERLRFRTGLRIYDALATTASRGVGLDRIRPTRVGSRGAHEQEGERATFHHLSGSRGVDKEGARRIWPGLPAARLRGGTVYTDAQFDDAGLAVALALTVHRLGSLALNYVEVVGLTRDSAGRVSGVVARDVVARGGIFPGREAIGTGETGPSRSGLVREDRDDGVPLDAEEFEVSARVVVDATGVFSEQTRKLGFRSMTRSSAAAEQTSDEVPVSAGSPHLALSRGSHIVLGPGFVRSDHALLIPRTEDGRVLFAIPWYGSLLVGTTDIPVKVPVREPKATLDEVDYLLRHVAPFLETSPNREHVKSAWAGLRPLVARDPQAHTSGLSREHLISEGPPGVVTVVGGKWTTYRAMAEEVVDRAAASAKLPPRGSATRSLPIESPAPQDANVCDEGFVLRVIRKEMAVTVEDVLARRSRVLFLDVERALQLAQPVAGWMAAELGHDELWAAEQVRGMAQLARDYLPCAP